MKRFALIIALSILAASVCAQETGLTPQTAVRLPTGFYHELVELEIDWLLKNVPELKLTADCQPIHYNQNKVIDGKNYTVHFVALKNGGTSKIYFDRSAELEDRPTNIQELFFFPEWLEIARGFDRAEVVSLKDAQGQFIEERDLLSKYLPLNATDIALLRKILTQKESYDWKMRAFCMPDFNARIRLWKDGRNLNLNFCFSCRHLRIQKDQRRLPDRYFASSVFEQIIQNAFATQLNRSLAASSVEAGKI